MRRPGRIAIDGSAGSGKSTVGEQLAQTLGYLYVDTGAMYRAVAWLALQEQTDLSDEDLDRILDPASMTRPGLEGGPAGG